MRIIIQKCEGVVSFSFNLVKDFIYRTIMSYQVIRISYIYNLGIFISENSLSDFY